MRFCYVNENNKTCIGERSSYTVLVIVHQTQYTMTNAFSLLVQEIKSIASAYQFDHDIELINGYAGISPISVHPELYTLILKSLRLKEMTDGAFDICACTSNEGVTDAIEINPLLLSVYLPSSNIKISLGRINDIDIN